MGDFGNSNSNYMGVTASGQIIQNHYSAWGGGTDNIKIYDNGNNTINEINPVADINYSCYTLSSGYCVVWGNPSSVYDIRGGSFKFEANLIAYSTLYNNKYIIAMPHNTIYLINRL